jgi:hypothetical protein
MKTSAGAANNMQALEKPSRIERSSVNLGMSPPSSDQSFMRSPDDLAGVGADRQAQARDPGPVQIFRFFASQLRSRLAISAGLK